MEHINEMLWNKTTQNDHKNIPLGDLLECSSSIRISSISSLDGECQSTDLVFSQCGVQCLYAS